jgi:hypothetical protein
MFANALPSSRWRWHSVPFGMFKSFPAYILLCSLHMRAEGPSPPAMSYLTLTQSCIPT